MVVAWTSIAFRNPLHKSKQTHKLQKRQNKITIESKKSSRVQVLRKTKTTPPNPLSDTQTRDSPSHQIQEGTTCWFFFQLFFRLRRGNARGMQIEHTHYAASFVSERIFPRTQ
eukprot:UN02675